MLLSEAVAWAEMVPVMSALVRGRNATEKLQEPLAVSVMQGGSVRTKLRGIESVKLSGLAVRLLMVNWRVMPRVEVFPGPKMVCPGMIWRPVSSEV
jgi:hypothetical protein